MDHYCIKRASRNGFNFWAVLLSLKGELYVISERETYKDAKAALLYYKRMGTRWFTLSSLISSKVNPNDNWKLGWE
jgi:hypothetical protein